MTPEFLRFDEVIEMHRRLIELFGGSPELRDAGLLQSALAMPASTFAGNYLHPTLAEMGAAYLFHIACNHPFVDGNKRTAWVAARLFLRRNGRKLAFDEGEAVAFMRALAAGELSEEELAAWFRGRIAGREGSP